MQPGVDGYTYAIIAVGCGSAAKYWAHVACVGLQGL
jgi:hypothetical protein